MKEMAATVTYGEANRRAADSRRDEAAPEVLARIRSAFEVFDSQSLLLQSAFDNLKRNLAEANRQLQRSNQALSEKVAELEQMSSRMHCILESLGDAVLVVNCSGRIERCNPAAAQLLGCDRSDVEGRDYEAAMALSGNVTAMDAALRDGVRLTDESRVLAGAGGAKLDVMAGIFPIKAPDGSILGAVEVLRDVSQVRSLEERVQHQKRMAALGEMAASVAHEIRNPLGSIEGFARLLKQDLARDGLADPTRLAGKIIEGAQNLNYVITNLLTYARPMPLQNDRFEMSVLMSSVKEQLVAPAAQRGVALEMAPAAGADIGYGDVRQLRQMLVNLGRNAIEACAAGAHVRLGAEVARRRMILTVTDEGCGIAPADLPRIFDPFFTRKEGGTGLGLALSHKIVAAHGGEIAVTSKEGKGTSMRVTLPLIGEKS
jgi:PAS domain S-box-containing protein